VDHLTRFTVAYPIKYCDSKSAIAVLEKHVIYSHGCPREILADQGSSFTSSEFKNFCEKYHIQLILTAAYKPDTNGVCERRNDVLKSTIAKHVNEKHNNWDSWVHVAAFSSNIATHRVTGFTPFFLLYNREPFLPCDAQKPFILEETDTVAKRTKHRQALSLARSRTSIFQRLCKLKFDQKHKPYTYSVGQKVLLANFAPRIGFVQKWLPKWIGPFEILRRTGENNYEIEDIRPSPSKRKPIRKVSVRHLKPFHGEYCPSTIAETAVAISEVDETNTEPSSSISLSDRTSSHHTQPSALTEAPLVSSITPSVESTSSSVPTSFESEDDNIVVSEVLTSEGTVDSSSVNERAVVSTYETASEIEGELQDSLGSLPSNLTQSTCSDPEVSTLRRSSRKSAPPDRFDSSKYSSRR